MGGRGSSSRGLWVDIIVEFYELIGESTCSFRKGTKQDERKEGEEKNEGSGRENRP